MNSCSSNGVVAALRSLVIASLLTAGLASSHSSIALATSSDGITAAIEIEPDAEHGPTRRFDEPVEAQVRPHWCAKTGKLVEDIHRLGGESVMRLELDSGRALERYWNASEEVVIEHDRDGNSCLVEIRPRRQKN